MVQNAAASARPAAVGDTLSFNSQPDSAKDLIEYTVSWAQLGAPRSDRYMVFKAKNVTACDADFVITVFVQKDYYVKNWGGATGIVEFKITTEWQYGQRNETGVGRFLVLHDSKKNQPFQERFVSGLFPQIVNLIHGALSAFGQGPIADKLDAAVDAAIGRPLLSYGPPTVQNGDVLLIPSELKPPGFDKIQTIKWVQNLSNHSAEYYKFNVANSSQDGKKVVFYIEKEWWDSDSTSDNHISKVATKNADGYYEFKIDNKSQFGQKDESGHDRWVVYHDKDREIYQHRFVQTMLQIILQLFVFSNKGLATFVKFNNMAVDPEAILDFVGRVFGSPLRTFVLF